MTFFYFDSLAVLNILESSATNDIKHKNSNGNREKQKKQEWQMCLRYHIWN